MKTVILYGINPIYEALKAGRRKFDKIFVSTTRRPERIAPLLDLAQKRKIPVHQIKPTDLTNITGAVVHQGIAARVTMYPFVDLSSLKSGPDFVLMLDNVVDPHNMGALIRTALSVGVDLVIFPKHRSVHPSPVVSKVSSGALEHIKMVQVVNLVSTINKLKQNGLWIIGLDAKAKQTIYDTDFNCPAGLIIGGEDKGIRALVKKNCDFLLSIPQSGPVTSLNASVAGAVAMYEIFRQKYGHKI
ncbi:23S rRNA (guanosine2251-2'-O)-methyltransferase [Candidatus Magnetomoraceae bacterium gMMP-15]